MNLWPLLPKVYFSRILAFYTHQWQSEVPYVREQKLPPPTKTTKL